MTSGSRPRWYLWSGQSRRVPGPHWLLGCLSREHWGRKGCRTLEAQNFWNNFILLLYPQKHYYIYQMLQLGAGYPNASPRTPVWAATLGRGLKVGGAWLAQERIHFPAVPSARRLRHTFVVFKLGEMLPD